MVGADKISKDLEKQLKTLAQPIRIEILKILNFHDIPVLFSALQKEIAGKNPNSANLSFHLKSLKECNLIASDNNGYTLTVLGKQILQNIASMEQILNNHQKTIMIRTSKYSKEQFNLDKIEEYLIREGEMEPFLAKKIALEVQERLSKTNIEYLTAPLMREYINGVLLENGLEKVRHKLTRLGTPPYEAAKLFENKDINPELFIKRLGSDVSEQFLLLNLLPNDLADLYLSGEIVLLHLNYWSLRPLSAYLSANTLLDFFRKKYSNLPKSLEKSKDLLSLILDFKDFLSCFKPFISEDFLIGNFNKEFLSPFNLLKQEKKAYLFTLLSSQILSHNLELENGKSHLSLEFNFKDDEALFENNSFRAQPAGIFLNQIAREINFPYDRFSPFILFDYTKFTPQFLEKELFNGASSPLLKNNIIYYNSVASNLLNSTLIKVNNSYTNESKDNIIVLDKILINLYLIALEARQNDNTFLDLLQEKVNAIFKLFKIKEELTKKKVNSLKTWNFIISEVFGQKIDEWTNTALKSISFFGLNEAINKHCGIELDRIEKSETFALKALAFLKKLIEEKNDEDNNRFTLSQPHYDKYLVDSWQRDMSEPNNKANGYTSQLIREETTLPLGKQISLFKKFEKIVDGGIIFNACSCPKKGSFKEDLNAVLKAKLNAFYINDKLIL